MNILFIGSGNAQNGISPLIKNQGESLVPLGHRVSYFAIQGKGLTGYLRNIFLLKKYLRNNSFDIIHAHYSFCGYVASLAGARPVVVSLMGSDVKSAHFLKYVTKLFYFFSWKTVIVKSKDLKDSCGLRKTHIIPNGVDFNRYIPIDKTKSMEFTKWDISKKHVLFNSNPARKEKNFVLAKEAVNLLADKNIELHTLVDIASEKIPFYLNAADVVLLTSLWEGSPNIIKEAMACNRPIVTTNVGDVNWLVDMVDGCFISKFNVADVADKIRRALDFRRDTNGRERLVELGLDSKTVANKIVELYLNIYSKHK